MRHLILCISLLLATQVTAQYTNACIVTSVSGEATTRLSSSQEERPLIPGPVSKDATIILKRDARVNLMFDNRTVLLNEPGKFLVRDYVKANTPSGKKKSFFGRFFQFLSDGLTNTSNTKTMENYHEQYLNKSSGGIKGFAGTEFGILACTPVTGRMQARSEVDFSWFSAGDSILYDFQIRDFQSDGLIYKAMVTDTTLGVPFNKLALEPGRKYYWMVEKKRLGALNPMFAFTDDPAQRSPKVEFVIDDAVVSESIKALEAMEEYQETDDEVTRLLMKAQYLEEQQAIYSAYQAYQEASQLDASNTLVKQALAAFLIRQGLVNAATKVLGH
jgi:hypothetical protein